MIFRREWCDMEQTKKSDARGITLCFKIPIIGAQVAPLRCIILRYGQKHFHDTIPVARKSMYNFTDEGTQYQPTKVYSLKRCGCSTQPSYSPYPPLQSKASLWYHSKCGISICNGAERAHNLCEIYARFRRNACTKQAV